jgi:hypothetical protein
MDDKQLREAFDRIMGDPSMPAQDDPGYDEWLFRKAVAAGMERAAKIMNPYDDEDTLGAMNADAIRAEIKEKG